MALDKRLENLNLTIELQEQSLKIAKFNKEAARGTELGVLRFEAEVRRNQSEKLIVNQDIVVAENRINFLLNRFPQPVERVSAGFFDLNINRLDVGVPSQLLQNRPDIRQAERDLAATGLDVKVARINFFPQLVLTGGTGLQTFVINHLFEPQAVIGSIAERRSGRGCSSTREPDQGLSILTANARQFAGRPATTSRHPQRVHRGYQPPVHGGEIHRKHQTSSSCSCGPLDSPSRSRQRSLPECPQSKYIDVLFARCRDLQRRGEWS